LSDTKVYEPSIRALLGTAVAILSRDSGRRASQASQEHRKVDVRLPGKGNSNSHGARPVHLIIMMIQWVRTSRLSIKNSLRSRAGMSETEDRGGSALVVSYRKRVSI